MMSFREIMHGRGLILLPLLLLLCNISATTACLPGPDGPPSLEESYETAASIFTGTVTNIQTYYQQDEEDQQQQQQQQGFCVNVTLKVLDVWKSSKSPSSSLLIAGESVMVSTASNDALCGFAFAVLETYVVWTSSPLSVCGSIHEQVDLLGRTTLIRNAQAQSDVEWLVNKRTSETGSCSFSKRCCVEDCCGVGTSWDGTFAQRCVSDRNSDGWNGNDPAAFGNNVPQCLDEYPCCEDECCGEGTYFDPWIAYCVVPTEGFKQQEQPNDPMKCGPRPLLLNYQCPDGVTLAGPGDCIHDATTDTYQWDIVACPPVVVVVCKDNKDCEPGQFCSKGTCRPVGSCLDWIDCLNPSNTYPKTTTEEEEECHHDNGVHFLQCSKEGQCAIQCSSSNLTCPKDEEEPCLGSPCAVTRCGVPSVACVDYYHPCGGCSPIFFDAAGNQVCGSDIVNDPPVLLCKSDGDCDKEEYCSQGQCRSFGYCGNVLDCKNPANQWDFTDCVGYYTCNNQGRCDKECGKSSCPENDEVKCLVQPCSDDDKTACEEAISCVPDVCGGCNEIYFDGAGYRVCKPEDDPPVSIYCESDKDCGEKQYCSQGDCRDFGSCGDVLDCHNPANEFAVTKRCLGFLTCDNAGQCDLECSASGTCPDGDLVQCLVEPCRVVECEETYVSCVNNYCGGCNAILYDTTGSQVCAPDPGATICKSDEDCGELQFCSEGQCRNFGTCGDVLDCKNPANKYPSILCIGYDTCDGGRCGKQCADNTSCPDNDEMQCLVSPCSDNKMACPSAVSCVPDFCGGCKAIFFDAAGHQVCDSGTKPDKCNSGDDCRKDQYCSRGYCRNLGTCADLLDCQNPNNDFTPGDDCDGYLQCGEEGQCELVCGGKMCPEGDMPDCGFDPCTAATCIAPSWCFNDFCNCAAIFFDPAGNRIC